MVGQSSRSLSLSLSPHNATRIPAGLAPAIVRLSSHVDYVYPHIVPSIVAATRYIRYHFPTPGALLLSIRLLRTLGSSAMATATRPLGGLVARGPVILSLIYRAFFMLFNLPLLNALPVQIGLNELAEEKAPLSPDNPTLWIYLAVAVGLVLLGGIFAGLTIALMGQVRD